MPIMKIINDTRSMWHNFMPSKKSINFTCSFIILIVFTTTAISAFRALGEKPSPVANIAVLSPPGSFRPTDSQWNALTLMPVVSMAFRGERETDGRIATNDDTTTPVFSPFSGRVSQIFAKAGDRVARGDPLLEVEASEFVQAQNDLIAARATLTTAQAQLALAETAEKRQHELFNAKGAALKDWQQAELDLSTAKGAARTAEIGLAAARNRLRILGKSTAEIAALEQTRQGGMSAQAIVRSPIAGTVIQRQVGLGQYIASSTTGASSPVFSIGDLGRVWLVANVRETDAAAIRVGLPVEVSVPAYPDRVFQARLTYVAPALDPATRRLPVRAEIDNSDGALKPEMFARFRIVTGADAMVAAVPEKAVVREGEAARVWVADPEAHTLAVRNIRVGQTSEEMVEVLDGLRPGETVVTAGAVFIDRAASSD